jgi:hypothetical protein
MRIGAAIALVVALSAACRGAGGGRLFKQYEYEEEMVLALDGSATVYVNASVPALNLLRGSTFDERPNARLDREAIREYFTSAATRVTRVSATRRNNRRYFHVRIDVTDVRALGSARPFAWSAYSFRQDGALFVYQQTVGAAAAASSLPEGHAGWSGGEITAFRLRLPSRVAYHNTDGVQRGNILSWEQPLSERLRGTPLTLDARMETASILYSTLLLFGASAAAAAALFAIVIWRVRRSATRASSAPSSTPRPGGPPSSSSAR